MKGGLRASELLGLRWGDIDLEKGILNVRRSYVNKAVDDTKTPESEQELPTTMTLGASWRHGKRSKSQ
jgi:integrase